VNVADGVEVDGAVVGVAVRVLVGVAVGGDCVGVAVAVEPLPNTTIEALADWLSVEAVNVYVPGAVWLKIRSDRVKEPPVPVENQVTVEPSSDTVPIDRVLNPVPDTMTEPPGLTCCGEMDSEGIDAA